MNPSPIMPRPSTKWSQSSALFIGTKFAPSPSRAGATGSSSRVSVRLRGLTPLELPQPSRNKAAAATTIRHFVTVP
jgi:hypothetical protein